MNKKDEVRQIPISMLKPFPNHPFYVRDDEMMNQLVESIRQVGILVPVIARPTEDGFYELISGHRRTHACRLLGYEAVPTIIREVEITEATIMMVDSNFQREVILPSEKAKAYKMKLDAIKCQGARTDLTSDRSGRKSGVTSRELIAENSPDSSTQIHRYIRLNELIPELLTYVDEGKLALTPAAEISYLTEKEQEVLKLTIDSEQASPSRSQAMRMKKLSEARLLTDDMILNIMCEQKKADSWTLALPMNRLAHYFPSNYTPQKMQEIIFGLLDRWLAVQLKKQSGKR
ncbi:MAG: ParB/RepB/Spo0J family partition protein [Clostridiales bacterium]|nr:ParB/RepB/Spo0J family partition protein [Clostridiales bacterium]